MQTELGERYKLWSLLHPPFLLQLICYFTCFASSSHPVLVCFCPVGLSSLIRHFEQVLFLLSPGLIPIPVHIFTPRSCFQTPLALHCKPQINLLQVTANLIVFVCVNVVGVFMHNLMEHAQRKAFLDTRNCIAARLEMEDENEKLVSGTPCIILSQLEIVVTDHEVLRFKTSVQHPACFFLN